MSELARVEAEHRGELCLVHIRGEVDISNARDLSAAVEFSGLLPLQKGVVARGLGIPGVQFRGAPHDLAGVLAGSRGRGAYHQG